MSSVEHEAPPAVKLEDLCRDITVGHVGPMAKEYVEGGVPFLRSQNVQPFRISYDNLKYVSPEFHRKLKKSSLSPGDVVVVRTGYPGTACVIPASIPECNCADLVIIRPAEALNPHFLAAFFNSATGRARVGGSLVGVAQQHFNVTVARNLSVQFPPRALQDRIASILSAYDDLIENNLRRIQILEEMAQALYREWFVEFRFPGSKPNAPPGELPPGWQVRCLEDVADLVMGQSPKSQFYNSQGEGLPFHQGVTDFGDRFPTDRVYCTVMKRVAEPGDILFSVRAPVGRLNLAQTRLVVGRGVCAVRSRGGCQWFLLHQLKELFYEEDLIGGGAIFKAVTKKDMQGIPLVWPPLDAIEHFQEMVDPMEDFIATLTSQVRLLRASRDLLLPRLISGELDVSESDIDVGEAV